MEVYLKMSPLEAQGIQVALAPQTGSRADTQGAKALSSRVHVMLVEDSALIREALVEALAHSAVANFEGFATTASEAIAALRAQHYDIVVVDIELSKGTGFEVLQNLMQSDYPYPTPVGIVLTNHAYPVYKRQAELLGVRHFFDKSMHFNEAIEAIEEEATRLLCSKTGVE
jgi:DNA-binding NarL/FixJ family response regulator